MKAASPRRSHTATRATQTYGKTGGRSQEPVSQVMDKTLEAQRYSTKRATFLSQMLAVQDVDETAQHIVEECTFGPKMVLRQHRHNNTALGPITVAIRHGRHSGCYIHMDGRDPCNPHDVGGNPSKTLMTWLTSDCQQTSFLNVVVLVGQDDRSKYVPDDLVMTRYTEYWIVHAVAQT